ncbi:MAG: hypothetical protein V1827_00760 [Candidatus Micrarchaeota archaeon]
MRLAPESAKLLMLGGYFLLLAVILYFFSLGQFSWVLLLASAVGWFVIESRSAGKRFENALRIGAFLLVFDFIFENAGWLMGLWQTSSAIAVGVVPIEVMGITLFGGAAWALYLPKKFDPMHSLADSLIFASFGALGEWLLIRQGLFLYNGWWTSALAFVSYLLTWGILHFVRYRIFKD